MATALGHTTRPAQPCNPRTILLGRPRVPRSSVHVQASLHRVRSLPEDGHHSPQETPEAWILAQQQKAAEQQAKQLAQGQALQHKQQKQLTVPYLELEVTPELVAISMGEQG